MTLRLENGKELLFAVDTGASGTVLDKSLAPVLEPCHLGTKEINFTFARTVVAGLYEAPKFYSGNTRLLTGDVVYIADLSQIVERPVVGILGMDCLRHYCVQLDFAAGKLRFLDPEPMKGEDLGEKYPLTFCADGRPLIHASHFGHREAWEVDTGCDDDVALKPDRFQRLTREWDKKYPAGSCLMRTSTNFFGMTNREDFCRQVVCHGESHTNFILLECPDQNLIGLRYLARHLVTLNFPQKMMYLQRRSDEPFANEDITAKAMSTDLFSMEAMGFLSELKKQAAVPGWSKDDHGELGVSMREEDACQTYPISRTLIATKIGDVCRYHYLVTKPAKNSAWHLERAWRTDAKGEVVEELPVK